MKITNLTIKNAFPSKRKIKRKRERDLLKGKEVGELVSNNLLSEMDKKTPHNVFYKNI